MITKQRWRWIYNPSHRFGGYYYSEVTKLAYMWSAMLLDWKLIEWNDCAAGLKPWPGPNDRVRIIRQMVFA